jgi:hypothetical protein
MFPSSGEGKETPTMLGPSKELTSLTRPTGLFSTNIVDPWKVK